MWKLTIRYYGDVEKEVEFDNELQMEGYQQGFAASNSSNNYTYEMVEVEEENEDEEPSLLFSLGYISDNGDWNKFCDYKGWNLYVLNEGLARRDDLVFIPASVAKDLGFSVNW